jgi:hypothetical protein
MSVRRAARLAVLLAAVTAILGSAAPAFAAIDGSGGGSPPTPLPPDEAYALATAPVESTGSSTTTVDGTAVLAASSLPDAQTSIEPGVSPQAAVGLVPLIDGNPISPTRPVCWANAAWHQWGTWPYQQRITDTTYWCAVYGDHITYRTSTTTASGALCGVNWRASQLIGGGVGRGFTYFTIRASAGFACPTIIPWITIHTSHHEDVKRGDRGVTTFVGSG